MERELQVSAQDSENVELKIAYFHRLYFLFILEKAPTFISDELHVFKMVSRYDNRRARITPYNPKMQFEYTRGTEIQEVSWIEEGQNLLKGAMRCLKGTENPPARVGLLDSSAFFWIPVIQEALQQRQVLYITNGISLLNPNQRA
jgi:hypothetical protein